MVKKAISLVRSSAPEPPRKLGAAGHDLWRTVQAQYGITDIGGTETLMQICLAVDRLEALASRITRDGEVVETSRGPRAHPALRDELQTRAFVVRSLQRLGLGVEPLKQIGRPNHGLGIAWEDLDADQ
jgi:hypothetical protein